MPAEARAPALRSRLLLAMLGPLLVAAILIGVAGAMLIADVVRRTNDRVLAGALGAIAETVQVEQGAVTLDLPAAAFGMLENSERDNVFTRFYRAPGSSGDGCGLGLAIVRQIADRYGAVVTLDAAPGGGLSATVRFAASG